MRLPMLSVVRFKSLTGNSSSDKVEAESNVGGVGVAKGGGGYGMTVSVDSVVGAINSSVKVLGFSFSLTLSVVADIAGNWDIVGVNTGSTLQTNAIDELGISFGLTFSIVTNVARHGDVEGIDARSALETNTVNELGISFGGNCSDKDSNESIYQRV